MKAVHGRARGTNGVFCAAANSCFGLPVKNDESGNTFQFTGVSVGDGLILGYQQNFTRDTSATSALSQVLKWLPQGSSAGKIIVDHRGGSCGLVAVTVPALRNVLSAPKIGATSDVIGVDLEYINANLDVVFNPKNVEDAQVSLIPFSVKDSC